MTRHNIPIKFYAPKADPLDGMRAKSRIFRIGMSLTLATAVVWALYIPEQRAAEMRRITRTENWARQLGSQAEAMTLHARELGEKDPVGWTVSILSEGPEPRFIHASKSVEVRENRTTLDEQNGEEFFVTTRVLLPQEAEGVTLQIPLEYRGFLGTPTLFLNDLALALFGLGSFCVFFSLLTVFAKRGDDSAHEAWRDKISAWILGVKPLLVGLGVSIREMIRQAQVLAISSFRSKQHIEALRSHLHESLGGIHQSVGHIKEVSLLLKNEDLTPEILAQLRAVVAKTQQTLIQIELNFEPLTMEVDQAFNSLEGVQKTAQKMNEYIKETTQGILSQNQRLQSLQSESEQHAVSS